VSDGDGNGVDMLGSRVGWAGVAAAAVFCCTAASASESRWSAPASGHHGASPEAPRLPASADAHYLAGWIRTHGDNNGLPFAIVDKKAAQMHLFDEAQRHVGSAVVLLGSAPGDESAPDVGRRAQTASIAPAERTTPAGRFASEPGRNLHDEDIVWFDYRAALAIHRLRPDAQAERRAQRLATPTPDDNRASLGCVVVSVAFYEHTVRPLLGTRRGLVYVLPDTRPVEALWPADAPAMAGID
jgi:hypothetical protein